MELKNVSAQKIKEYNDNILNYVETNFKLAATKYLDLGVKVVRVLVYSKEYLPHLEKQFTFCLKDSVANFDTTVVLWKENDVKNLPKKIAKDINPHQFRIETLCNKKPLPFKVFNDEYSICNPIIYTELWNNSVYAYDKETETYFYGTQNLEPEEFIKEGHMIVQVLNRILQTETTNIAHGAVAGVDNKGILFCARGQRGKSTLVVLSMLKGFEYVSDDYLTLEKEEDELYTYPIYSIITLSPRMYGELYDLMKNSRFVSNNGRKDKYVFNIENLHNQFKVKYPIKCCIFPEIVSDKEPSITLCTKEEKGRAIVQLIQSTIVQMQDMANRKVIKKMFDMIKDFTFYKFNLCNDIYKNTEFLREYMKNLEFKKDVCEFNETIEDITFDFAYILNTKTYTMYTMNKFSTNVYENLKAGVSKENILKELKKIKNMPEDIEEKLEKFVSLAKKYTGKKEFRVNENVGASIKEELITESKFNMTFTEYTEEKNTNLMKI